MSGRLVVRSIAVLVLAVHPGCGGGGTPVSPGPTPTPVAVTPDPTPTPVPSPTPCPDGEECSTHNPVVRVSLRIYRAWDNTGAVINPTPNPYKQVLRDSVPVGYQFLFDVVGRDADGHDTQGDDAGAGIEFHPSDPVTCELEYYGNWQRKCFVNKPGHWEVYVSWAGVDSNSIGFTFVDCAVAKAPYTCN